MAPATVELESVAFEVSIQSPSEIDGPRSEPIELTALSLAVSMTVLGITDVTAELLLLAVARPSVWLTGWLSSILGVYIAKN